MGANSTAVHSSRRRPFAGRQASMCSELQQACQAPADACMLAQSGPGGVVAPDNFANLLLTLTPSAVVLLCFVCCAAHLCVQAWP